MRLFRFIFNPLDIPTPYSRHSHPPSPPFHPHSSHLHPITHIPPHSHPDSPHSHPINHISPHSHPDSPHSGPDSTHSHHSPHSIHRFPIPAFTDIPKSFFQIFEKTKRKSFVIKTSSQVIDIQIS